MANVHAMRIGGGGVGRVGPRPAVRPAVRPGVRPVGGVAASRTAVGRAGVARPGAVGVRTTAVARTPAIGRIY